MAAKMDGATRQAFLKLAGALLQSGAVSLAEMVGETPAAAQLMQAAPKVKQILDSAQQTAAPLLRQLGRSAGGLLAAVQDRIQQGPGKEPPHGHE